MRQIQIIFRGHRVTQFAGVKRHGGQLRPLLALQPLLKLEILERIWRLDQFPKGNKRTLFGLDHCYYPLISHPSYNGNIYSWTYRNLSNRLGFTYKRNIMEQQEQRVTFAIAPMIDISNTHFRYFMRLITAKAVVYTEMLHHDAVLHSHSHLLPFNVEEHPIVLQLGGCDPERLALAAKLGEQYGYD